MMTPNELRLQRLNYIIANVKHYDNKEYIEKLKRERDNILKQLL